MTKGENLPTLVDIMHRLLSPEGCPWDREQTLLSLRPYVVEEAHEVVDAIDSGDPESLKEELGDLLFQIVFQSELALRQGWFNLNDVISSVAEKMVRRHPWVFGDQKVESSQRALASWEAMKAKEKKDRGVFDGVPNALPALLRAFRVGEKAAAAGFDWSDYQGAREKVDEELRELDQALVGLDPMRIEEELGDLFFALASLARKLSVDPEASLRASLRRFQQRFEHAERAARAQGRALRDLDEETLDALWASAKEALKKDNNQK